MRTRLDAVPEGTKRNLRARARALGTALAIIGAAGASACGASDADQVDDAEEVGELEQLLGAPVTVSFQDGALPTSSYAGTTDASIKRAQRQA